jgi:hypothetical protein
MEKPSDSIIKSIASEVSNFDYHTNVGIMEEWCLLFNKLSILDIILPNVPLNDSIECCSEDDDPDPDIPFNVILDLDLFSSDFSRWCLSAVFRNNNEAYIGDCTWCTSSDRTKDEEYEKIAKNTFSDFLGFKGTWEEVTLKLMALNNLMVSVNTIPAIPKSLQE